MPPAAAFLLAFLLAGVPLRASETADFDGSGVRSAEVLRAAEQAEPLPQAPADPKAEGSVARREREAPDPRAGRDFRRVLGPPNRPVGPRCPDGSDPPCAQLTPAPPGSPPQGGYYYGWWPGPDGKPRYGKLYIPYYGPFLEAHNDPPDPALAPPPAAPGKKAPARRASAPR